MTDEVDTTGDDAGTDATSDDANVDPFVRHDAPDPNRAYTKYTPILGVVAYLTPGLLIAAYLTGDLAGMIVALTAVAYNVVDSPDILRTGSLRRIDQWAKERARNRRARDTQRFERRERVWHYILGVPTLAFMIGLALIIVAPVTRELFVVFNDESPVIPFINKWAGNVIVGLIVGAFVAMFPLSILYTAFQQSRGDVAQGRFEYYRVDALAVWIEGHPRQAAEIKLALTVIGVLALVATIP